MTWREWAWILIGLMFLAAFLLWAWRWISDRRDATRAEAGGVSDRSAENDAPLTAGDLTADHIGMAVLDVPGISGWERHMLLRDIERREDGLWLHFRWNDDPSNTKRGQYATGQRVDPCVPVRAISPEASD